MEKKGFWTRFFAWFLDGVAMGVIAFIVTLIIVPIVGLTGSSDSTILGLLAGAAAVFLVIILLLLQFVYFGYFWSSSGSSIGMKLLNMKVVRRNNEPVSFLRAALRGTVGYWVSGLFFGLGYIWAAFDADKEAWHDKIFDTWVV